MAEAKKTAPKKESTNKVEQKVVVDKNPATEKLAEVTKTTTAKAGKRSEKAQKEATQVAAKEARKSQPTNEENVAESKTKPKVTRSRLERRSKKYKQAQKLIDSTKQYELGEALGLIVQTSTTKFDASVELHINLNVDPRHADQNIRDNITLPAGTGKSVKIAVLAEPEQAELAKKAGADMVGVDEIFQKLDKENLDFDVLISTPSLMPRLGKYARLLGPKGLMPNPKSGTVTTDTAKAVEQAKAGRVEYRVDSTGIIHMAIGKVGFGGSKLLQNAQAITTNLKTNKPSSVKGAFIKSAFLASTMGPSIQLDVNSL